MQTAWHGPDPDWNKDRHEWMYDWISEGGTGMFGCQWHDIPAMCVDFILEQYTRFNVPFNKDIIDVARVGGYAAFHWVDVMDPYAIFWQCSDVDMTDDWSRNTFELHDLYGHNTCKEVEPTNLETFVYMPGQAEAMFYDCLGKPGLDALPNCVGHGIRDLLSGEYNGEECWDGLDVEAHQALTALCMGENGVDKTRMMAYFELAGWAAFLWLAGPLGRDFRRQNNLIIDTAMQYGEAIMIEGSIISPENYRKIQKHPQSCYRCGTAAWCVELTQDMGTTRFVCQACSNYGMPPLSQFHCGPVLCKYASCPNNPFHQHGTSGMYAAARAHGQLTEMARTNHKGFKLQSDSHLRLSSG